MTSLHYEVTFIGQDVHDSLRDNKHLSKRKKKRDVTNLRDDVITPILIKKNNLGSDQQHQSNIFVLQALLIKALKKHLNK